MVTGQQNARVDVVVNVDALWGAEPRWYRLGDVSLGERGVPQTVVFYAIAGVLAAWATSSLPLLGVGWWPGGLLLALAFIAAGFVKPNGLRVDVFAPVATRHLLSPRHLHGWRACRDPLARWRPDPLVLEPDGSSAHFRDMVFEGPGLVVRHRPARRLHAKPTLADRAHRRQAAQLLVEHTDLPGLPQPRELEVPAGARLIIKPGRAR